MYYILLYYIILKRNLYDKIKNCVIIKYNVFIMLKQKLKKSEMIYLKKENRCALN